MLDIINNFILRIADPLFNWLLYFSLDVAIVVVAILTSASLTVVRIFTTDQQWLKRADADLKRLKELIKEAKQKGDKEAVKRYKNNSALISMRKMKYEWKPLLVAIIPILLLATWAFSRLDVHPPKVDEIFSVKMYLPSSAIDNIVYLVPQQNVKCHNGWIQRVVQDKLPEPANFWERWNQKAKEKLGMLPPLEGVAEWKISVASPGTYKLKFCALDEIIEHDLLIGKRIYSPPVKFPGAESRIQAVETVLRPFKPFGVIPGIPVLFGMPPWMVAYLLIAIPFVTIIKRIFKIY
jgi:uncharacterized membrane protein (DUF106 family)